MSLQGIDSHVVGVAVRSTKAVARGVQPTDDEEDAAVLQLKRKKQAPKQRKGFSKG